MGQTPTLRWARAGAAQLLAIALTISAVPARAAQEGAESPAAVVAGLRAAAENEDFPAMMRLLTPEARADVTLSMVMGVSMMVAFAQMGTDLGEAVGEALVDEEDAEAQAELEAQHAEAAAEAAELQAQLEAILTRHGMEEALEDDAEVGGSEEFSAMLEGVDQPALVGDLVELMQSLGDEGGGMSGPPVGELEDLEIEGDRATGTVSGEPAEFLRIDGRWYFSPPSLGI